MADINQNPDSHDMRPVQAGAGASALWTTHCHTCGTVIGPGKQWADVLGKPFAAYYCEQCARAMVDRDGGCFEPIRRDGP